MRVTEAGENKQDYWQEENETKDWVFDIEKKYNRSLSQICDGIVAGFKREQMVKIRRTELTLVVI